jgi:copper(I)-binding protein
MSTARALALVLIAGCLGACAPAAPSVDQGRFKHPLPGKTVSAGYFDLRNPTPAPITLTGVSADTGSSVEIHRTVRTGDQVRMERLKTLKVAPGETLKFEPGSYHLMLFGLERLPEQIRVTLHFADGSALEAPFEAEPW